MMYSTKEAADILGVSVRRISALIASGELEAEKFSGAWMISKESVERRLSTPRLSGRPKAGEKDPRKLETYTLMNGNHEVLDFVYHTERRRAVEIPTVKERAWIPFGARIKDRDPDIYKFNNWIEHRYIPSVRPNLRKVLQQAELEEAADLMFSSWDLNLSDHYWFRPAGVTADWHDINYFENDFSENFGRNMLDPQLTEKFDLRTPDSATPGMLPKRWEIRDGERFLIKGSSTHEEREPYNELLATRLLQRLAQENEFVPYEVIHRDKKAYSSCPTMASMQTEFIAAADIGTYFHVLEDSHFHTGYLTACKKLGIRNAQASIDKMIVADYLMANFDRHFYNFGIVRDAETLGNYRIAPLFDHGAAFFSRATTEELRARRYTYESHPFKIYPSQQLALVEDLSWYDPTLLDGFPEEMASILSENKNLDQDFIETSVEQVIKSIDTLNDLAAERRLF